MHQSSVNMGKGQRLSEKSAATGTVEYVAFGEITRNAQLFVMSNTTPVPPLALLLLCGNLTVELAVDTVVDTEENPDEDPDDEEKPGPIAPDVSSICYLLLCCWFAILLYCCNSGLVRVSVWVICDKV
jgi:hypothetical protein